MNVKKRPGGRTARTRAAVMKAFLEALVESGYSQLTFESLAERAGVHKATLYRRWGSRENLLLDAALAGSEESVPVPDTGSLEGDLRLLAQEITAYLQHPGAQAMLRAVVSEAMTEPKVADVTKQYWSRRLPRVREIANRAVARGEIPLTDPDLVIEAVVGPLYFKVLVRQESPDDGFIAQIAHLVAKGAGAAPA